MSRFEPVVFTMLLLGLPILSCTSRTERPDYRNPALSAEKRAADLLSCMTVEEKIAQLSTDVAYAQKMMEDLNSQVSILKAENMAVREQNDSLNARLSQVSQEKEALALRLSSVAELKKAIRDLKKQMRKVRSEIKFKEEVASGKVLEGNRGFLLKDGKPTYPTRVKIEVKSLSPNE